MKNVLLIVAASLFSMQVCPQSIITPFENSHAKKTATYEQCLTFYYTLSRQFNNIILKQFDNTDAGLPLHVVLYSADKQFDPAQWHKQGKVVLLINNGIHPGEPDGIDASMMLLRDVLTGKIKAPKNVVLAIIPIYNIGGSLNRNSFSRVNQDGPESYGFRGNAQNLDLNRDFTKNDSRNAMAFAKIFHWLDPDIFIDNHVSDGADYQNVMTLLSTQQNKLGEPAASFLHDKLEPELYKSMAAKQFEMTPYVNFEAGSPDKGWVAFYDAPRYSSGFAALFQTIGFMPETHMLKSFEQRVRSTYALMQTMMEVASKQAAEIKQVKRQMITDVIARKQFPLSWKSDTTYHEMIPFKGYRSGYKTSDVTGQQRLYYDRSKPLDTQVKYYNRFVPADVVTTPTYYIIPQGWWAVIERLKLNNVAMTRIKNDTTINVEAYRIEQYKSFQNPYEKHHPNYDVRVSTSMQPIFFRKGDYVIACNQRANRYIAEMLEPTGGDSFFAWNFFDAILQQKEGYSQYRWEDVAAEYVAQHPDVKKLLEDKKRTDSAFAASAAAQLNFVYKHSPYYEPAHMRYPVYRWHP